MRRTSMVVLRSVVSLTLVLGSAYRAAALYLDENQNISLRARVYSQAAVRTEGSYDNTTPTVRAGQLVEHRNFYNPELEAKLASYTTWLKDTPLSFMTPDAFDFRLAGWGFYDGLYDYGPHQFIDQTHRTQALFFRTAHANDILKGTAEREDARDIFAHRNRVNELYLSYSKGPVFVRVGRQAISWGESDTIGILDQNNPFDLTLGAPGIFEDLDEARIPLWTIRSSYSLFDTLGPLSSGFVEAYWVPGDIDTTTAMVPPPTWSPYVAPGPDPRSNPLINTVLGGPSGFLAVNDQVPASKMSNSRYGFRFQTVVARDYTVSLWYYTTFNQAPVPVLDSVARPLPGSPACVPQPGLPNQCRPYLVTDLVHELEPVVGVSNTFFVPGPLDGIVRMELEYFNNEPGFIPEDNLLIPQVDTNPRLLSTACKNAQGQNVPCVGQFARAATVPHADFLRWELGFDRFFFFRPLNPTNSFVWVTAFVGSFNMSETHNKDFRFDGQQKPGTFTEVHPVPDNFVQLQRWDNSFVQTHLQTDYLHGRLSPAVTVVVNRIGAYAIPMQLTYRYSDSLLFDVFYTTLGGAFTGTGFFRDRDQLALRATLQLN